METKNLTVNILDDLVLSAGTLVESADAVEVLPPERPMFDQLLDWLGDRPCKQYYGAHGYVVGIGATALCLRYGTWLAALMDDSKPVDPRAKDGRSSMISDGEMMRINIEASANLARLLEMIHADDDKARDICWRAYEHLPMPQRKVRQNRIVVALILSSMMVYHRMARGEPEWRQLEISALQYPFRAVANTILHIAYRNRHAIENVHAGRWSGYDLEKRRFTRNQSSEILRSVAESLGPAATDFAWRNYDDPLLDVPTPWPQRVIGLPYTLPSLTAYLPGAGYPGNWSLDAQSASFKLLKK